MSDPTRDRLPLVARVALALRIWSRFVLVRRRVHREPLPQLTATLAGSAPSAPRAYPPAQLSRAVDRSLSVLGIRPRCLVSALVLYRLLHEQGDAAELVIGLPRHALDQRAHAWVELEEVDVGPPPGRGDHVQIARFGGG